MLRKNIDTNVLFRRIQFLRNERIFLMHKCLPNNVIEEVRINVNTVTLEKCRLWLIVLRKYRLSYLNCNTYF